MIQDGETHARAGTKDPSKAEKLIGLEAIRFLSAFSVLIWHYQHFYYIADKPGPNYIVPNQPLYGLLAPFYQAGYYGVNVFWCISGFIFFWKYRDIIADRRISITRFTILRLSRLYPLHFMTLLFTGILQKFYFLQFDHYLVYLNNDSYHFIMQLFFASNWGFQHGYSFNGPIWSISVEVLIYVIFFTTIRLFSRSFWPVAVAITISIAAKALRLENPIFDCLGFFFIGGLVCLARNYVMHTSLAGHVRAVTWIFIFTAPALASWSGAFGMRHFSYLFWLVYTPLLLFGTAGDLNIQGRARAVVEAAGNMTYSSYLIHFPLQLSLAIAFARLGRPIPVENSVFLIGFVLATLILSYFIYELFEMPAQRLIRSRFC